MNSPLDRRTSSASPPLLPPSSAQSARSQTPTPASAEQPPRPQPHAPPAALALPPTSRKNFVGIQVRGFAWVDEGVDQVLDNIQKKGDVNTVWAYTFAYGEQRLRRARVSRTTALRSPPQHRRQRRRALRLRPALLPKHQPQGFPPHRLRQVQRHRGGRPQGQGPRHGLLRLGPQQSQPHARPHRTQLRRARRGRPERPQHHQPLLQQPRLPRLPQRQDRVACSSATPNWSTASPGAASARARSTACVTGGGNATCFCQFCQAKARELGISVPRAQAGYREIGQLFRSTPEQVPDGYFTTFWRTAAQVPRSPQLGIALDRQLPGRAGRALRPRQIHRAAAKPFGFHLMQTMTFSPFYRAEEDYTKRRNFADFFKIATYNNAGGPRLATYLERPQPRRLPRRQARGLPRALLQDHELQRSPVR